MSDGQSLFLVLCFLYFSDCFVWIGRSTILFSPSWFGRWRFRSTHPLTGNANGSLLFFNPFPSLNIPFLGHYSPISISPIGICDQQLTVIGDGTRPVQTGYAFSYDQITEIGYDGKYLTLNNSRFAKCASPYQAELLAEQIIRICREPEENRERIIREYINNSFSKTEATTRLKSVTFLTSKIRWTCLIFFYFLYVIAPILVSTYGLTLFVIPVAIVMLLTATFVSMQYSHTYLKLYKLKKSELISSIAKMVLCPPVAIRAPSQLSLESMSSFHPVVIANLFLGDQASLFYGPLIRDLYHPLQNQFADAKASSIVSC